MFRLGNGLTGVCAPMPGFASLALGVWVRTGSRHEPARWAGITHFLEHLVFKGAGGRSAREIAEWMDAIGADLNAYTTKEHTAFTVRCMGRHLPDAMEALAGLVLRPALARIDVERERRVVLDEIRLALDAPDDRVHDLFESLLWSGSPLGRPVLGTEETLRAVGSRVARSYFERAYTPQRMVVVAAGNVDPASFRALVHRHFAAVSPGQSPDPEPALESESSTSVVRDAGKDVHVVVGTEALRAADPRWAEQELWVLMLGGGPASRLFQELREERGLCYSVYAFALTYRDTGAVGVYTACPPRHVRLALDLIGDHWQRLAGDGPGAQELERAKEQWESGFRMGLEQPSGMAQHLGEGLMLLDRVEEPEDTVRRVRRATVASVRAYASTLAPRARWTLAGVGPISRRVRSLA